MVSALRPYLRCLIAVAVCAGGARAQAQEQVTADAARALYLEARFREAAEAFEGVLVRPDLDVGGAAEAHVHLAMLRHTLGEPERARAHAEAAVALVPDVAVPEGAAQEVIAAVTEARERFGAAARLSLELAAPGDDVAQRRARAVLEPAPAALGLALAIRCDAAEARGAPPDVEVALPASDEVVRCQAAALSAGGAVLFSVRRDVAPAAALRDGPAEDGGAPPWPWVALGVGVAAAVGIVVAVVVSSSSGGNPVISATQIDGSGW